MARRARRGDGDVPPPALNDIVTIAREKFTLDHQARTLTTRSTDQRDQMSAYAARYGTPDAKGHRTVRFPEPLEIGGKKIRGFIRERRVSYALDEDAAMELLEELGEAENSVVTHSYTEIDQEKLFALQQRGRISAETLDALFDRKVTYSIKAI